MEDDYRWFGNVSPEAQEKITEEVESYIRNGMGRCKCGPLNITAETDSQDIYYVARIRCKCGESDFFGDIEGVISVA